MSQPYRSLIFILVATIIAVGCSHREASAPPVQLLRLEYDAPEIYRSDSLSSLYHPALEVLANIYGVTTPDSALAIYTSSAAQNVFTPDIANRFLAADSVAAVLGNLRARLPELVSGITIPQRIYTVVSPYRQSVILADTTLIIALNHYLGADYPAYASFEPYIRSTKTARRLPLDVAEAVLASTRPYVVNGSSTALSRMLYEGALLHTIYNALPSTDMATLFGYTSDQLQWAEANEQRSWHTIVGKDLLFSTDPAVASRLVSPAPATTLINPAAPGRLGRFIGFRIIQSYLNEHPDTPADSLITPSFYNSPDVLREARYAP